MPSGVEGDLIISKLDPLFKSGNTLLHDGDLEMYIKIYLCSVMFFTVWYLFFQTVWRWSGSKVYYERTEDQKVMFTMFCME